MNTLLMFAGAALVATGGAALAQDAGQPTTTQATPGTMMPGQIPPAGTAPTPMATPDTASPPAPTMPDAQSQATQSPDASMAPSAAAPAAPHSYPMCTRSRHDECRNPGGK